MRVLIVEDEIEISNLLTQLFEKNNYVVDQAYTLAIAFEAISSAQYHAVILDRNLPDGDGLDLLKRLSARLKKDDIPPFLILSAMDDIQSKVVSLDSGAIDYVTKPYEPQELLARLRVCIRQGVGHSLQNKIEFRRCVYNLTTRQLNVGNLLVSLRRRELVILDRLIRNPNQVVSLNQLEQTVYGYNDDVNSASKEISNHISRLRKALRESHSGLSIRVMRHIGYSLEDSA